MILSKKQIKQGLLLIAVILGCNVSALMAQNVGVNTDTPKATLDVQADATNANALDGIIAPRLTAEQLNAKTYTAEQTGAMVYVTAVLPAGVTATAQLADVNEPGQYLFNGTKWVQSAGQNGAEWVYDETTKQLNLMRSSTAPFDNKVYYDTETGGFFDYQDSITDAFNNTTQVFTRDTLDLRKVKYYRQSNSKSVEGVVNEELNRRYKHLHSEQIYVDESTTYSENLEVSGGVFNLTTSRSNAAPTRKLSGFNMGACKLDGQRTTYMWGLGAGVSTYAGDIPGYITAFRNDIYLNTPGTVNMAYGTNNHIAVAPNSGHVESLIGELYAMRFYGNSTHEYVEGVRVKPYFMNESNPTINNLVGFRYNGVHIGSTGAGTINNEIGLVINDVDKGIKSNYAIYTNAGKNSLGDTLQVRNINATTSTAAADKVVVADAEGVLKTKDVSSLQGGLEKITENERTGYRLRGINPDHYGDIGQGALDLTYSTHVSDVYGATGEFSTAMGFETTAQGPLSTAMGYKTVASGAYSTALGNSAVASGEASIALGNSAVASGKASTAMGVNTIAEQTASIAMGDETAAIGNASTAMGKQTNAFGLASTAMGEGTKTAIRASLAMGLYHTDHHDDGTPLELLVTEVKQDWKRLVTVGNGTSESNKSDAFTILRNGKVGIDIDNFETTTSDAKLQVNGDVKAHKAIFTNLPVYADDAAADADGNLPSGSLYKLSNSGRQVFVKP